jgi:hypothetical protein
MTIVEALKMRDIAIVAEKGKRLYRDDSNLNWVVYQEDDDPETDLYRGESEEEAVAWLLGEQE